MVVLGIQVALTMIAASMLQKLGPGISLANWLLCSTGLVRYLHPTDEELKKLVEPMKEKTKSKKRRDNQTTQSDGSFMIRRNLDIQLESEKIRLIDVVDLPFYYDYQWLVDFGMWSCIVYSLTEVYYSFMPGDTQDELNLSLMWCWLILGFSLKVLVGQAALYFKGDEASGERSLCLTMGFTYFFVAMIVLILDEDILELGLEQAYSQFNHSATLFLEDQVTATAGPASKLILKLAIAVWCGFIGAIFTFPGFRMSKMHWNCLKYCKGKIGLTISLYVSFIAPFLLVVLWIKPIARYYLAIRIFSGMSEPLMTEATFETMRVVAIIGLVILRLCMMPYYLQSYLNIAYDKIEEQKKEGGRISSIEVQKKVARVFYYLCVIAVQYTAPIIMCLFLALMYKTLGGYTWLSFWYTQQEEKCMVGPQDSVRLSSILPQDDNISDAAIHFSLTWSSLKQIFTTGVYRGIFGFCTWWTCFCLFATSGLGVIYRSYFERA